MSALPLSFDCLLEERQTGICASLLIPRFLNIYATQERRKTACVCVREREFHKH